MGQNHQIIRSPIDLTKGGCTTTQNHVIFLSDFKTKMTDTCLGNMPQFSCFLKSEIETALCFYNNHVLRVHIGPHQSKFEEYITRLTFLTYKVVVQLRDQRHHRKGVLTQN